MGMQRSTYNPHSSGFLKETVTTGKAGGFLKETEFLNLRIQKRILKGFLKKES